MKSRHKKWFNGIRVGTYEQGDMVESAIRGRYEYHMGGDTLVLVEHGTATVYRMDYTVDLTAAEILRYMKAKKP